MQVTFRDESGDELETQRIEAQPRARTWIERITEWVAKLLARP